MTSIMRRGQSLSSTQAFTPCPSIIDDQDSILGEHYDTESERDNNPIMFNIRGAQHIHGNQDNQGRPPQLYNRPKYSKQVGRWWRFGMLNMLRRSIRPRVPAGSHRIEWLCVRIHLLRTLS